MRKAQIGAALDRKSLTLLKTIRALTRPIVARQLDGPKRCIWTRMVGMPIIRVAHKAADLKVLAVPAACPMRWSTEGYHGHSRTVPQEPLPAFTHVNLPSEET